MPGFFAYQGFPIAELIAQFQTLLSNILVLECSLTITLYCNRVVVDRCRQAAATAATFAVPDI
jgi:hypothetical protein